jgi:hypothetical protein
MDHFAHTEPACLDNCRHPVKLISPFRIGQDLDNHLEINERITTRETFTVNIFQSQIEGMAQAGDSVDACSC